METTKRVSQAFPEPFYNAPERNLICFLLENPASSELPSKKELVLQERSVQDVVRDLCKKFSVSSPNDLEGIRKRIDDILRQHKKN